MILFTSISIITKVALASAACPSGQYKRGRWFTTNSFNCKYSQRLTGALFKKDTYPATDDCRRKASKWDHQVVINQYNQGGNAACDFFSLKNAADTPCTWTNLVELGNGDANTGLKWYLPITPGESECAPCPDGMICDGVNFRKITASTTTTTPTTTITTTSTTNTTTTTTTTILTTTTTATTTTTTPSTLTTVPAESTFASTTTSMLTRLNFRVQKEEIARALSQSFVNGDLKKSMLGMPALSKITMLKLLGKLEVQKEDAQAGIPGQLFGKFQLGGLHLSGFHDPQRDAFKVAIAATSGARKDQVFIKNVFTVSGSSPPVLFCNPNCRLLVDDGVVVEFVITIDTKKKSTNQEEQAFYVGVVAASAAILFAVSLVAVAAVMSVYKKLCPAKQMIGLIQYNNQCDMQITEENKIEMGIQNQPQCTDVKKHRVKKPASIYIV